MKTLYTLAGVGLLFLVFYGSSAYTITSHSAQGSLTEEQQQIYGDFIESLIKTNFSFISKSTFPLRLSSLGDHPACLEGLKFDTADESSISTHDLDRQVLRRAPQIRFVGKNEQLSILQQRDEAAHRGNGHFEKDPGVLALSEIKLDTDHHFAVVKYVFLCGVHCNSGAILVLEKSGSRWIGTTRRPCSFVVNSESPLR